MNRLSLLTLTSLLAACAAPGPLNLPLAGADAQATCTGLQGATFSAATMLLPSGAASIHSATWQAASAVAVAERANTPAARITPAAPAFCKVLGHIAPFSAGAPPINFQVNLPAQWNGRSLQFGGGGFNGVLISGQALPPAARFDEPGPLASGYATVGTDSGHQNKPGEAPQAFAANDEAFVNFAHASYKKVRELSVAIMQRAYGRAPEKLYFMGSSEGGREGLTMAQRYPEAFDGIFSRVPVINWTGLMHMSTRAGLVTMGDAWLRPAQVGLMHDAVLAACDARDGLQDGIVSDPVGCKRQFDVASLRCTPSAAPDACLNEAQIRAVLTIHSAYRFPFDLANGVNTYPGWGISGENTPPSGSTGGWRAWTMGASAPTQPAKPDNAISWFYGSGALRHIFVRDANFDVTKYKPEDHATRVREVSALMDSTNPDLSAFHARGGKLIVMEYMADYAQSPYAGIQYVESVQARMGQPTAAQFLRLYTVPGVDHVGSGAPANVNMLATLADWVERGKAPAGLTVVEQIAQAPFTTTRARPLCEWPLLPRYQGGDVYSATSFACAP